MCGLIEHIEREIRARERKTVDAEETTKEGWAAQLGSKHE